MANGEGALVAQQRAAAEIPYENIKLKNPAEQFLSTFFAASQISNQRRKLEEALLKMDMDSRFKEQNYELNVAKLQMTAALQTAEHNRKMEGMQNQLELGTARLNLASQALTDKETKDKETMEQITDLSHGLGSIDLAPNDPGRPAAIWSVIERNPRAARTAPGLIKDAFGNYNQAARVTKSKLDADVNDLYKDAKSVLGPLAGAGTVPNLSALYNLETWKDQWVDKDGNYIAPPAPGETPPEGAHKTGKKFVMMPSSDPNRPIPVTAPAQKLIALRKRLDELNKRRDNLPSQVSNEYVQPESVGVPRETVSVNTIEERNALQPGTRYIGPDGKPHIRGND